MRANDNKIKVGSIQKYIVEAYKHKDMDKVSSLQISLIRSHFGRRYAVNAVVGNVGGITPGVDGILLKTEVDKAKVCEWIKDIVYHPHEYKADRRKVVKIPKPGTTEMRSLNIPTIRDRALQMLYVMATDPIVEETSDGNSFGFRKGRSTQHAVLLRREQFASKRTKHRWAFETDIEKCFDRIDHQYRLDNVPNVHGKPLLKAWLQTGTEKGKSNKRGIQQGGVVSPILANIALNGVEAFITNWYNNTYRGNIPTPLCVRYVDDLVISAHSKEMCSLVCTKVEEFLKPRGLNRKEKKTRVVHISEGVSFLGWSLREWQRDYHFDNTPKGTMSDMKGSTVFKRIPDTKSVIKVCRKIRMEANVERPMEETIKALNLIIKGWCSYYSCSVHSRYAFDKVDSVLWKAVWRRHLSQHPHEGKKVLYDKLTNYKWMSVGKTTRTRPTRSRINNVDYDVARNIITSIKSKNPYV